MGECDSSVYVPATAVGGGYWLNKRSASYPTIFGRLSPSWSPVPAYTQLLLFVTTYAPLLNGTPAGVGLLRRPASECGRLCYGDGAHGRGACPRRVPKVAYAPPAAAHSSEPCVQDRRE